MMYNSRHVECNPKLPGYFFTRLLTASVLTLLPDKKQMAQKRMVLNRTPEAIKESTSSLFHLICTFFWITAGVDLPYPAACGYLSSAFNCHIDQHCQTLLLLYLASPSTSSSPYYFCTHASVRWRTAVVIAFTFSNALLYCR